MGFEGSFFGDLAAGAAGATGAAGAEAGAEASTSEVSGVEVLATVLPLSTDLEGFDLRMKKKTPAAMPASNTKPKTIGKAPPPESAS